MGPLIALMLVAGVFLIVAFFLSWFTVEQQTSALIERFGRFHNIATAGLNFKIPVIDTIAALGGDPLGGLVISFTAGWPAGVPEQLKLAIKVLVAHLYEKRESETPAPDIAALIAPYRQVRL